MIKLLQILWKIIGMAVVIRVLFEKDVKEITKCLNTGNTKLILNKFQTDTVMILFKILIAYILADCWIIALGVWVICRLGKIWFKEDKVRN